MLHEEDEGVEIDDALSFVEEWLTEEEVCRVIQVAPLTQGAYSSCAWMHMCVVVLFVGMY